MEIIMLASDFKKHLVRALVCADSSQTDFRGSLYIKDKFFYSTDGEKLYKGYLNISENLPEYRISAIVATMIEKALPKKGNSLVIFDLSNKKIILKNEGVLQEFSVPDTGVKVPPFEEIFEYQIDQNACREFFMENLFPVLKAVSKERVKIEFVTYPDREDLRNEGGPAIVSVMEPHLTGVFVVMPFIETINY